MWFKLTGDGRLGFCASDACGGQPTWRFQADGVGSNYCSGCKARISPTRRDEIEQILFEQFYTGEPGEREAIRTATDKIIGMP